MIKKSKPWHHMNDFEKLAMPARIEELIENNGKVRGSLVGINGNAFTVVGHTVRCLRRGGWSKKDIAEYQKFMFQGDYEELLYYACRVLHDPVGGWEESEAYKKIEDDYLDLKHQQYTSKERP